MGDPISSIDAVAKAMRDSRDTATGDTPFDDPQSPAKPVPAPLPASALSSVSAFEAHVIGQSNRKRGLKGGAPMLEQAKSAYLETEFSGESERRARKGRVTRKNI